MRREATTGRGPGEDGKVAGRPTGGGLEDSARRVVRTTGIAATSGALLGTFLAMRSPARGVRQLMTSAATSAASLGMLGLSFSAAKEYTRKITGSESPINSAVGGAAAGGLLFASHGGNPVLGAALVAALATVADAASAPTIQGADASDSVATISKGGAEGDDGTSGDASASSWWSLGRWVRKQSEEERLEFLEKSLPATKYSGGEGLPGKSDVVPSI